MNEGRFAELYDLDVVRARERAIAEEAGLALGDAVGPWWNPPFYAWAFAPLARLRFSHALLAWCAVNLLCVAASLWMLRRIAPQGGALAALLVLVSAPFLQSLTHGQNSGTSLLLLTGAALAWTRGRDFTAGALVGLLMYKPQLAAALAAVLVVSRGRRAAGGLLAVGSLLLAVTVLTMPGALTDYLHRLPHNLHVVQIQNPYLWERHVTLKSFWRLLLQGRGPGETGAAVYLLTALASLPLGIALMIAAWRGRRRPESAYALLAATVTAAPLLMPFYFDYDLLLLTVPAVLVAGGLATAGHHRWLLPAWCALYVWLFVNPYVAGFTRLNVAVPLLATVATLLTSSALRAGRAATLPAEQQPQRGIPVPGPLPRAA